MKKWWKKSIRIVIISWLIYSIFFYFIHFINLFCLEFIHLCKNLNRPPFWEKKVGGGGSKLEKHFSQGLAKVLKKFSISI